MEELNIEIPKDAEELDKMSIPQILEEIKLELSSCSDESFIRKYEELQKLTEELDLSILDSNDYEIIPSPTPKRRKTSRASFDSNDGQSLEKTEKYLEETRKQIDLVKRVLNIIYSMENSSFKYFISKRKIHSKISIIKRINDNGRAIPLWVELDEKPPPLCGAIKADDDYIASVGDMVAALVKKDDWILAEVTAYDTVKKEYTVDDIYEDDKTEHILSWNKVIPLPTIRADPETNPYALFQKDDLVLALYPGTTCFYRAIVGKQPTTAEDPYTLYFEDETFVGGYSSAIPVHQRYVIHNAYDIKRV